MLHLFFGFSGRIGRGMWWLAQLVAIPIAWIVGFSGALGLGVTDGGELGLQVSNGLALTLALLAALVISVWINVASTVKRYHDRGKSGFWFLLCFVPLIGPIWQLIECGFCTGEDVHNDYGPPPGSADLEAEIAGMAQASGSRLATLDDRYFEAYAALAAQPAAVPALAASPPRAPGGAPVFGKR